MIPVVVGREWDKSCTNSLFPHITSPKISMTKANLYPVVMYGCKSWTIKKVWITDAFELCSRRLLRSPWTARRPNQSILKEINPEYSLEKLMLKFQYLGHLMQRTHSLEKKDADARKDWRQEEKGATEDEMVGWHHWLNGHEFEQAPEDKRSLASFSL